MTLEVVSRHSVRKDTILLRELYHKAGIPEYWLVNVGGAAMQFDLLRWKEDGYAPSTQRSGWMKSGVFGKSFKLIKNRDRLGDPDFILHIK